MKHYQPNFDEFCQLTSRGNTIPVYRQLLADALTPVMAYKRLANPAGFAPAKNAFLLESVVGGEQMARFSFASADPEATFTVRGRQITLGRTGAKPTTVTSDDPLVELGKMLQPYQAVHLRDLPRFTGGVVGYAAYDMVRYYEELGARPARRPQPAGPVLRAVPNDGGLRPRLQDHQGRGQRPRDRRSGRAPTPRRLARSSGSSRASARATASRPPRSTRSACRRSPSRATSRASATWRRSRPARSTSAPATSSRWCLPSG